MQCRACYQQTFVQQILVMPARPKLWSTNVDYHQCWWRHHLLFRQRTIMDENHRGGWTQRFQTAKVTFKTIKCHPQWYHSIGHIRFPTLVFNCNYVFILYRFRYITTYFSQCKELTWPWPCPLGGSLSSQGYKWHIQLRTKLAVAVPEIIASIEIEKGHVTLTATLLGLVCHTKARSWYSLHACNIWQF